MPLYIMMTNLTDEGRKTVKTNPNRIKEVNKEVEAMGVKILAQYVTLGMYDFINILEAPNNERDHCQGGDGTRFPRHPADQHPRCLNAGRLYQ